VNGAAHFVEIRADGIDFDIECGWCGYTERNVATDPAVARLIADAHEAMCPEAGGEDTAGDAGQAG
jgi:hypothetical protein